MLSCVDIVTASKMAKMTVNVCHFSTPKLLGALIFMMLTHIWMFLCDLHLKS